MSAPSAALQALRDLPGVRRAWPGKHGELVLEQRDDQGRLRAGKVAPDGTTTVVEFATDPGLPALEPPARGELVVHRLGRRAVVLEPERAVKILRPGRAPAVAEVTAALAQRCAAAGLGAAQVVSATPDTLSTTLLPGRTLHDLGAAGRPGWEVLLERWPALASQEDTSLSAHGPAQEAQVLEHWLSLVREHCALEPVEALGQQVNQVRQELLEGRADPYVLLHRDLHDKQLLWDGRTLSVLDMDTAARGEAALDLGNLLAHLRLRVLQGVLPAALAQDLRPRLRDLAADLGASPSRLALYTRAAALRLACVYAFRPSSASWMPRWLEEHLDARTPQQD